MLLARRDREEERTRRCTCPARLITPECVHGHLVEEHPWIVEPDMWTPWDYEPRGPFRLQRWHEGGDHRSISQTGSYDLLGAIDLFVSRFMPPVIGYQATVVDERFKMILCYTATEETMANNGMPGWYGVQAAFDVLTPLVGDPMTVAIWESMARERAR